MRTWLRSRRPGTTYDNLIRVIENPEVREPLKFLRAGKVGSFPAFRGGAGKD